MAALVSEQPTQVVSKPKAKAWRTQPQWKALQDNYQASGLTKTVFCQQNGIASSSLYKWQNYFADQAAKPDFIYMTAPIVGAKTSQDTHYPDGDWQVELEAPILTAWQHRQENRHPLPNEGNRLLPGPDQAPDTPIRQNRQSLSKARPP